jgi:hypothetical protein
MLKSLLGASAAIALLLGATTALAHPHKPASSQDRFDRVGRPSADHVRATPTDHAKSSTAHAKQVVQRSGQAPVTKRAERVVNCSEFVSCSGSSVRARTGGEQSAKGSNSSAGAAQRSASEAYMRKVFLQRMKAVIQSLAPAKGCTNGVSCWEP